MTNKEKPAPAWWPAVESILNEYGLQAIDFVSDFKEAQRQARSADKWVNATTWRGLTDEEFESIEKATLNVHGIPKYFGTAIEAKLKEKNNGLA